MSNSVRVVPNDPIWKKRFESESHRVLEEFGENGVAVHHIGSTAIPSIVAKPIIDMLGVVRDIELVDKCNAEMERLGYEVMGEYGIPTRRYFRKDNELGEREYHFHVFQDGNPQIDRHLAFRDFMNAHPQWAQAYSDLKLSLVAKYSESIMDYHEGKSDFIQRIDQLAAAWRTGVDKDV